MLMTHYWVFAKLHYYQSTPNENPNIVKSLKEYIKNSMAETKYSSLKQGLNLI